MSVTYMSKVKMSQDQMSMDKIYLLQNYVTQMSFWPKVCGQNGYVLNVHLTQLSRAKMSEAQKSVAQL